MIKLLRVDYRLVHGQVAISWSRHIGADCILVANDEVAKDEMRQSMLRLSKPQGMKLVIKSIEDSVKSIKSGMTRLLVSTQKQVNSKLLLVFVLLAPHFSCSFSAFRLVLLE